jgi:hypothetical protein
MCWLNVDDDEGGCYVITMSDTKGVSKIYVCFSQYGLDDEMGGIQYREGSAQIIVRAFEDV